MCGGRREGDGSRRCCIVLAVPGVRSSVIGLGVDDEMRVEGRGLGVEKRVEVEVVFLRYGVGHDYRVWGVVRMCFAVERSTAPVFESIGGGAVIAVG